MPIPSPLLLRNGISAVLRQAIRSGSVQGLFMPRLSKIYPVFPRPTFAPSSTEQARAIVRNQYFACQQYANFRRLTQASSESIAIVGGEFGNNGYTKADGSFACNANAPLHVELYAAMMDENVNQNKLWQQKDLPNLINVAAPNAILVAPKQIAITGHISSTAEPSRFIGYGKSSPHPNDGFKKGADGTLTTDSGDAFVADTGPLEFLLHDADGQVARTAIIVCSDVYGFLRANPKATPGRLGTDIAFVTSHGSPLLMDPKQIDPALNGLALISTDTVQQYNVAVIPRDAPDGNRQSGTGVWSVDSSPAMASVAARFVTSRLTSLMDLADSTMRSVFSVSVKDRAEALGAAQAVRFADVDRFGFDLPGGAGTSDMLVTTMPVDISKFTDKSLAALAEQVREGKIFVGGLSPEPTAPAASGAAAAAVVYGPEPEAASDAGLPALEGGGASDGGTGVDGGGSRAHDPNHPDPTQPVDGGGGTTGGHTVDPGRDPGNEHGPDGTPDHDGPHPPDGRPGHGE